MRIEETSEVKLTKADDKELLILKLRFTQLWDKNFKGSNAAVVGSLNRSKFLKKYKLLLNEMSTRQLNRSTSDIDRVTFKKAMVKKNLGIDVSDFDDIIIVEDYIAADANLLSDVTSFIKQRQDNLADSLAMGHPDEFDTAYIPLYDLVLRAKSDTVKIEVSKPYPNEHSARLQDPDKFDPKSFRRTKGGTIYGSKKVPSTVAIIWGKLKEKAKPSDKPIPQALRFLTKDWTVTKAKKWLSDNSIKFDSFESAKRGTKKMWSSKYIEKLPDSSFLFIVKDDEDKVLSRLFPYIDSTGKVNLTRLQDTIKQIPKNNELDDVEKSETKAKAENIVEDIKDGKEFEEYISVYLIGKADDEEHIVCGVVYEPNVPDAQNDKANEVEIRKAAYQFMEKVQLFKVNHKGRKVKVSVLESYVAPTDFIVANKTIKKGSWVLTVRVLDKKIWDAVKKGELTGFSMAGYARSSSS